MEPRRFAIPVLTVLLLGIGLPTARANLTFFSGIDPGVGPTDPRPISAATAANFNAAASVLGGISVINFENLPTQFSSHITLNTNASVEVFDCFSADDVINNGQGNSLGVGAGLGFNTTPGGSNFFRIDPKNATVSETATFTFNTPVQAFGAYFTGLGDSGGFETLSFNDGTPQSMIIMGSATGGSEYFGFTDPNASISTIALTLTQGNNGNREILSMDDLSTVPSVPEPSTLALSLIGLTVIGLGQAVRRRVALSCQG
jgi:hypothetical protein